MDRGDWMAVGLWVVAGFCLIGLTIMLAFGLDRARCQETAAAMELQHTWGLLQGCMVQVGDHLEPLTQQRTIRIRP